MMAYLHGIIFAVFAFTHVSSQSATITVENRNSPDVYKDEPIQITCTYTLTDASAASTYSGFGIHDGDSYGGCIVAPIPDKPPAVSDYPSADLGFDGAQEGHCQAAYNSLSTTGTATISFTLKAALAGDYRCAVWGTPGEINSDPFSVPTLLVLPSSPVTGTVTNDQVFYEGEEVNFMCTSTGGVPAPVWNYTKNGEYEGSDGISFVGSRGDGEITMACDDTSHENWAGDSAIISYSATINVLYLYAPMTSKNLTFNPGHTYDLRCDTEQNLQAGDSLVYTWYKNGMELVEEKGDVIALEQEANATSDSLSCRAMSANDVKLQPVTIQFNVLWDAEASTPTKPTEPPASKAPPKNKPSGSDPEVKPVGEGNLTTIIIIVVVVVIVVTVLIVVVVVIVRRRAHQGSAETTTKGENRKESKDVEQANTDGTTGKEEEAKLISNPEDTTTKEEEIKSAEEPEKEQKE